MTKVRTTPKKEIWLNRLSIDAAFVAVVWTFALTDTRNGLIGFHSLVIIGLSTWLTYIGDHLIDVSFRKNIPETGRHLFFYKYRVLFSIIWCLGFATAFTIALLTMPAWKLGGGLALLACVVLYFSLMQLLPTGKVRTMGKRLIVSLIYTGGIYWISEAWLAHSSLWGTLILWLGCCTNLLVITKWEGRNLEIRRLGNLLSWAFLILLGLVAWLLPAQHDGLMYAALIGAIQFFMLGLLPLDMGIERRRFLADIILLTMGLVVIGLAG